MYFIVARGPSQDPVYGPSSEAECKAWAEANPHADQRVVALDPDPDWYLTQGMTEPTAGFGVRFNVNGPASSFVAWFGDRVQAQDFCLIHVAHSAVIVPTGASFL